MGYNIFLDDLRTVQMIHPDREDSEFHIVRTYDDFVAEIEKCGLPAFISFDNDLGCDENGILLPEGYDAAKWLVYESGLDLSALKYHVHSSNPVAVQRIKSLLENYIGHLRNGGEILKH